MKISFACAAVLALLAGCSDEGWGPEQLGQGHTSSTVRQLSLGRDVYANYCVGCHGEKGDGNGPAARFFDPKPRDFRVGRIKFANVSSGEAPRDEDYVRIVTQGLAGTAMPSFALLSTQERAAVVAYVKTFSKKKQSPGRPPPMGGDPFARDPARGIAAGKAAYHATAKCWSCHPAYEPWPEIARLTVEAKLPEPEPAPDSTSRTSRTASGECPFVLRIFCPIASRLGARSTASHKSSALASAEPPCRPGEAFSRTGSSGAWPTTCARSRCFEARKRLWPCAARSNSLPSPPNSPNRRKPHDPVR